MTAEMMQPSPQLFFETATAYQRTAAIKAAIELDVFTAVGEGKSTAADIAVRCAVAERGARILCDYLTMIGFLTKRDSRYSLTGDSASFLDRRSPAYLGSAVEFLSSSELMEGFRSLTDAVRKGGTAHPGAGTVEPENPMWVTFARAMHPMMRMPADALAQLADPEATRPLKILDIAAGHGAFGVAFAKRNPQAEVYAVDWGSVLAVAGENAAAAGVSDRHHKIPGSAFDVDYGSGFDIVLLTNFLHHFDPPTNVALLKKVHAALKEGGRVVTLEFVPNDDRVSPPGVAGFSLSMLVGTQAGDAYTYKELDEILSSAGFVRNEIHPVPPLQQAIISYK
jgi:ubiquinone/menaquinone biosynthesis C-methylase UbiE